MKRRGSGGAAGEDGFVSEKTAGKSYGNNQWKRKKRNEQRLGGSGLSLEAFVNAKSNSSGYNPALLKKQREFYRNAKFVSKYKKTLKQQSQPNDRVPMALEIKDEDNPGSKPKPGNKKRKKTSLHSIREEYEKKLAEDEKAKMEREAIIQAKKEARAEAEAKRKSLKDSMSKKTRSGQPVMKYRIEHLLEGLLDSSSKQ